MAQILPCGPLDYFALFKNWQLFLLHSTLRHNISVTSFKLFYVALQVFCDKEIEKQSIILITVYLILLFIIIILYYHYIIISE